jgi:flagellar motor component MotA
MVVTLLAKELNGLLPTFALMGKAALAFGIIAGIVGLVWRRPAPRIAASLT